MIIKTFFNWTTDTFVYPYGGEERTFKAGSTRDMDSGMANFFAKHLADWQMEEQGISPAEVNMHKIFFDKCFISESEQLSSQEAEDKIINQDIKKELENVTPKVAPKKKMGRPAKAKVEEFEGV